MIKVLFFARLREQLGVAELTMEPIANITELRNQLQSRDEKWAEVLAADNIIVALNQEVAAADAVIVDGDEVAFYPPVTGG